MNFLSPNLAASTQALIERCDQHMARGDWEAALELATTAANEAPLDANVHYVRGGILAIMGSIDDAHAETQEALRLDPTHAGAFSNLGAIAMWRRDYAGSARDYRRALALRPGIEDAKSGLAYALLAMGDFAAGWAQHERSRALGLLAYDKKEPVLWDGSMRPAETLTLFGEAGLGDVLQFCRLAPLARERVGRIVFYLQPYYAPLAPLLSSLEGVDEVTLDAGSLRRSDVSLSVLSLPYVLNASLAVSPVVVPYLAPDPVRVQIWRQRLREHTSRAGQATPPLRVGLVWGGNPRLAQARISALDRRRSVPFDALGPLLDVVGAEFHTLQLGSAASQLAASARASRIVDLTAEIADFADTAALIAELDLVISVDTSVAHLAGALGRPVWMMNRFDSCWRWGSQRDHAPWYPSMRIFRQQQFGEWGSVVDAVAQALKRHLAEVRTP